jgi:DHA2 family multidrug resistance protein-like MFS transporter
MQPQLGPPDGWVATHGVSEPPGCIPGDEFRKPGTSKHLTAIWGLTMAMENLGNEGTAVPARAGRREWVGLGVLALACLLYAMDLTVLHLAVPRLSADLRPSSAQLLWIIDIYGFLVAGSLITMGTLGDRIGRRRLLMIGAGAFGLASLLAALSTSATMLIASRAIMGVAGATLAPSTLSLIFNMFMDPKQRSVAVGIWIASFSAGGAIGPVAGGLLLERFWWGSVFLLALPVMAVLLMLGPRVLPEFRDPEAGRLDLVSAALSLAAILAVIYGLKQTAVEGFGFVPGLSILAGLTVALAFVRRQARLTDPMIDLRLFRIRSFSASLTTYMLSIFVAFGYFLFVAQYLQLVLGLSPLQAGLWSLPSGGGFIVGSVLAPTVIHRFRPAVVMTAGLSVAALGLLGLTRVGGPSSLTVLVVSMGVVAVALAPVITLSTELIVGSAPPERAGAASGISETSAELGGALGIAILGSIGAAIYRSAMAEELPAGIPAGAAETARDTLGGAVAVAGQLSDRLGEAVIDAAHGAFTQGLRLTTALSAIIAVAVAVLAASMLRGIRGRSETIEDAEPRAAPGAVPDGAVAQPAVET